jgi:NhaA family Na+:H+ antiporter
VPTALKVFLAALAIVDDLGAIIVIALFYTHGFSLTYFLLAMAIFGLLLVLNRLKVSNLSVYLIPGVLMWYFMLRSGVHATLTGVLLAFAVPFGDGSVKSPSYVLQHFLHKPVAFIIMPIFALANTGIILSGTWVDGLLTPSALGVIVGLLLGKPIGILLFSLLSVRLGLSQIPQTVSRRHIIGAGFLGGIGFTMSIFITLLAFNDPVLVQGAKIAILFGSFFAGAVGFILLRSTPALPPA